ncbi:MAG: hypothetical protein EOO46_12580, partial [Flavobacterium sp.]
MKQLLLTLLYAFSLYSSAQTVSLYAPSNGATVYINPILQWYDVAGETGYIIQVDTVNTFDSSNLQSSTVGAFNSWGYPSAGTETLAFGTTYYWRVAILNGASQSDWSTVRSFTTISNPSLYSPSNVEIVNINPILQWYDVGGETGYIVQVDTVNTFDSSNLQSSTVGAFNGSGYPAAGTETLAFGTTYYWRVAILSGASQSDWSTDRSFTTVSQPTLYSPVAGEVVNGVFVILQWYDYSGET